MVISATSFFDPFREVDPDFTGGVSAHDPGNAYANLDESIDSILCAFCSTTSNPLRRESLDLVVSQPRIHRLVHGLDFTAHLFHLSPKLAQNFKKLAGL